MNRFLLFIKKVYVPLLFLILEAVAVHYYAGSSSYTKAKLLTASNAVVGGLNKSIAGVRGYFGLWAENRMLLDRLAKLENQADLYRQAMTQEQADFASSGEAGEYEYIPVGVVRNSISRQENFIVIDRGERDGIRTNMALITPENTIVGYVQDVGDKFATAISVINTEFRTGGKIKGKEYFGSIWWDGSDHRHVTLSEIPKYADIAPGDTIVTCYSSIFPPDVVIGTVESVEMNTQSYYDARVRLSTPIARLGHLFAVNYADIQERLLLEQGLF